MYKIRKKKSLLSISKEWDALASTRFLQIVNGGDITYRKVLVPNILKLIANGSVDKVLDAGCGVGFLTNLLARQSKQVIGIDPSAKSIILARNHYGSRVTFIRTTLEKYSRENSRSVDVIVANMVLMDVVNLDEFLQSAAKALRKNGKLVFSIAHPCFWPAYYGYKNEPWFQYNKELIIEGPFKITTSPECKLKSTHVHRPLEAYIQKFYEAQFSLDILKEPMPSSSVSALYPNPWVYPRYIIGMCRKKPLF